MIGKIFSVVLNKKMSPLYAKKTKQKWRRAEKQYLIKHMIGRELIVFISMLPKRNCFPRENKKNANEDNKQNVSVPSTR